jgi:anaerobic magnesium-protoporphyrin IX monomethyl ester cyclase
VHQGRVLIAFAGPRSEHRLGELGEEIGPPLGALSIAARLREALPRLEIRVADGVRNGNGRVLTEIDAFRPDLLLLSCYTPCAEGAYHVARRARETLPRLGIVLGGPHVTSMPIEAFLRSPADVVAVGEGEESAVELCRNYRAGEGWEPGELARTTGILYRDGGSFVRTVPRPFVRDLDTLPFPARDLVDMSDYRGFYITKARPETNVVWSRGCPYSCTFCSNEVWKLSRPWVRARSPSNILDEVEHLVRSWGIREVFDNADEFNHHLRWARDVCSGFVERDLGVVWKTQVRASPLPADLVSLMSRAGCWCVHLGIESANPETLKGIGKGISPDDVRRACGLLKDNGIKVHGLFMLFNVWEENGDLRFEGVAETERTLEEAARLADDGLIDFLGWSITTPYPGSPLFLTALRHGLIPEGLIGAWDQWLRSESFVMHLPNVSGRDQARLKTRGSALRARRLLLSGNIRARDAGYLLRKFGKLVQLELRARVGRR